jgi:hypothetical protein
MPEIGMAESGDFSLGITDMRSCHITDITAN